MGTGDAGEPSTRRADERLSAVGPLRRLLVKPELGALVGAVAVFAFFAVQSEVFRSARGIANWLDPASTLGIMAVAVALLMIGGHFDLSAGVMTGTTALTVAIVAVEFERRTSGWRSASRSSSPCCWASSTAGWSPAPACPASSSRWAPSSCSRA
ncbi:hypothetical protein [Blastococcus sp. TML/C7B]|uniref:hypothetical protein n=1 Tax=Blastococcus sp. TML/C7B TaxID=2798728 RepID=UPI001F5B549A|nr:hypothetical protein [Blastococcus sp. TML/C7B]